MFVVMCFSLAGRFSVLSTGRRNESEFLMRVIIMLSNAKQCFKELAFKNRPVLRLLCLFYKGLT